MRCSILLGGEIETTCFVHYKACSDDVITSNDRIYMLIDTSNSTEGLPKTEIDILYTFQDYQTSHST